MFVSVFVLTLLLIAIAHCGSSMLASYHSVAGLVSGNLQL